MNYKDKKQKLVEEFNRNQQTIQGLVIKNQQIVGQIQIIEELCQEESTKEKEKQEKE